VNLNRSNGILAVLALALAVPTVLVLRSESSTFTALDRVPRLFDGFTSTNMQGFVLGLPKGMAPVPANDPNAKPQVQYDMLQVARSDKGWQVAGGDLAGAPVQASRVENDVIKHLTDVRTGNDVLVVKDATDEQLAAYDLSEEKAFVIKAVGQGNSTLAELLVGKDSSSGKTTESVRGVFVRTRDGRDIWLYEVPYLQRAVDASQWIDKVVHQVKQEQVTRFTLRNPASNGLELAFSRKDGSTASWTAEVAPPETGALRQMEVENLVQRLLTVSAAELRRPAQGANLGELGLQPPQYEVSLTTKDGETEKVVRLLVGAKVDGKEEYYASSSESKFLLTLPSYLVTGLERNPKELFDPKAPAEPAPPGDAKAAEVPAPQPQVVVPPAEGPQPSNPPPARTGGTGGGG
jgi:hypothetical protein